MVRNLVGMIVDIGRGAREVDEIAGIFEAKDRKRQPSCSQAPALTPVLTAGGGCAGSCAGEGVPAEGLTLMHVEYNPD